MTVNTNGNNVTISGIGASQQKKPISWEDFLVAWNIYHGVLCDFNLILQDPLAEARASKDSEPAVSKIKDTTSQATPFVVKPEDAGEKSTIPNGFCFTYSLGVTCIKTSCRFAHFCYNGNCGKSHPFKHCPHPISKPFRRNNQPADDRSNYKSASIFGNGYLARN